MQQKDRTITVARRTLAFRCPGSGRQGFRAE